MNIFREISICKKYNEQFCSSLSSQPCLIWGYLYHKITSYKASLPQRGLKRHRLSAEHSGNKPMVLAELEII